MDYGFKVEVVAGWAGGHENITDREKRMAVRPVFTLARRAEATRPGIEALARQALQWYRENITPIPNAPRVSLATLQVIIRRGDVVVAKIDAVSGRVLQLRL